LAKHAFRGGRTADIAHADEKNRYFFFHVTSAKLFNEEIRKMLSIGPASIMARHMERKNHSMTREKYLLAAGTVVAALLAYSFALTHDRATWIMEVAPVFIAAPILIFSYRRFPLTSLLYILIFTHALILILGGTYTYARVPLGFWLQEVFDLSRNPYDKIGHFAQGFVPAMIVREILLRGAYVTRAGMAGFLSICVAMAISAWYELIEWWAALALGQGADEFLGTQGDPWDTQSDMFLAFIGASLAIVLLSRLHERMIGRMKPGKTPRAESAS
jgi:putative membrane protein